MASDKHRTPDFKGPRRSGSHTTPDSGAPRSTRARGAYPADKGGPPDGPGQAKTAGGYQGDYLTPHTPPNGQIDPAMPRKTVKANTTTNPIK